MYVCTATPVVFKGAIGLHPEAREIQQFREINRTVTRQWIRIVFHTEISQFGIVRDDYWSLNAIEICV